MRKKYDSKIILEWVMLVLSIVATLCTFGAAMIAKQWNLIWIAFVDLLFVFEAIRYIICREYNVEEQ